MRTQGVRSAMLEATPVVGPDDAQANVFGRIHRAADLRALWYLRSDLMAAISGERGELIARREVAAITKLFDGLLPEARSQTSLGLTRRRQRF